MSAREGRPPAERAGTPAVRLLASGLTIAFGNRAVLSELDLAASGRQLVAITGPSGSGKTTLLMVLAGLIKPDSGSVEMSSGGDPGSARLTDGPPHAVPDVVPYGAPTGAPDRVLGREPDAVPDPAPPSPATRTAVTLGPGGPPPRWRTVADTGRRNVMLSPDIPVDAPEETPDVRTVLASGGGRARRSRLPNRRDSRSPTTKMTAIRTGYVPQTLGLVPWLTAAENVAIVLQVMGLPSAVVRGRTEEVLAAVGLEGASERIVTELSGGQRQRVAVARALAPEPDVLLADEPTAELDAENRQLLLGLLIAAAARGALVIVTTHDPDVSEACDVNYVLEGGRLSRV